MNEELDNLRQNIDKTDQELISILKRRLQLVAKVGEVKSRIGVPVYAPEREASMLAKRRRDAEMHGLSPQMVEDVLRRVMRESYSSEHDAGFKCVNPSCRNIVIIGGNGQLGSIFASAFRSSGYHVDALSRRNWDEAEKMLENPSLVIVCVPIDVTDQVIRNLSGLPEDCVLADFTSVKSAPLKTMLETHRGPVMGLHPMFGPDIASLAKQVIVYCEGRFPEQCQWVLAQMRIWGARIEAVDALEHDEAMSIIQALRHFTTYAYGVFLAQTNADLDCLVKLSSPIYRLELMMVGRLFAQDPNLYADIILSAHRNLETIRHYSEFVEKSLKIIDSQDKEAFVSSFLKAREYFGDYAAQFMRESKLLLDQAHDHVVHAKL
jgi:chorismate mutase/prephenate dehydrogenase